jgi:hypothetical protein
MTTITDFVANDTEPTVETLDTLDTDEQLSLAKLVAAGRLYVMDESECFAQVRIVTYERSVYPGVLTTTDLGYESNARGDIIRDWRTSEEKAIDDKVLEVKSNWIEAGTVVEHKSRQPKWAYTRWYVATKTGERVWYRPFVTKKAAWRSDLFKQVKSEHSTAFVVQGNNLMVRCPNYRVMVVAPPASDTAPVTLNPNDYDYDYLADTDYPQFDTQTTLSPAQGEAATAFARQWAAQVAAVVPEPVIDNTIPVVDAEPSAPNRADVLLKAWQARSATAIDPVQRHGAHDDYGRKVAPVVRKVCIADSAVGAFDDAPVKRGIHSERHIGHEVPVQPWWVRPSEFPMGDTSAVARAYAAGR